MALKYLGLPRTQLLVRMITVSDGQVVPLLTDAEGFPLPLQRQVSMAYDSDGRAEITVTFAVDGEAIQLLPDCRGGKA